MRSRLTPNQKSALNLVRTRESTQCISGPTWSDPYTAFIHYRTAESLRARGLVAIGPGPDYDITLPDEPPLALASLDTDGRGCGPHCGRDSQP